MSKLQYTSIEEIDKIHEELKASFAAGKSKPMAHRKYQLVQLMYLMKDNAQRFEEALKSDLGRPPFESQFFELISGLGEIRHTYANIDKWAKSEKPAFSLNWSAMRPVIHKEPKGVVLVISPFNYPVWLSLPTMASAIAAGNTVILKPSESTPATSALMEELVHKYLDTSTVRVVNGSIPETTRLLEKPWGHILYTGNGRVAKIVSAAAAKTLSPVSLELGGKSPVFIDPKSDFKLAARRILWGKIANAGQTCVAPDYIMVTEDSQDRLIEAFKEAYNEFYPANQGPKDEGTYSRLVTAQAFSRINGLLQASKGEIIIGGEVDEAQKYIQPTVVKNVTPNDSLMSQEIFGPVLPIMPVKDVDEAIAYVNSNDHPLALYVFSQDESYKQNVFSRTQSGSAVANDVVFIPGVEGLPFGGIGPSGSGYHTGKFGFDMFIHFRASLDSPKWIDYLLGFRYPPYTPKSLSTLNRMLATSLPARPSGPPPTNATNDRKKTWTKWLTFVLAAALAGGILNRELILQKLSLIMG